MVRAGRYPPPMPRFEEEETMTQEQFNTLMEGYWRSLAQREPADWSAETAPSAIPSLLQMTSSIILPLASE